jgi:hypothetical protein
MKDDCKIKSVTYSRDKNIISFYNRMKSAISDKTLLARSIASRFPNDRIERIGEVLNLKDFVKDYYGVKEVFKPTIQKEAQGAGEQLTLFYNEQLKVIDNKRVLAKLIKEKFPRLAATSIIKLTGWKSYRYYLMSKDELGQESKRKAKYLEVAKNKREKLLNEIKIKLGGKCCRCNYNKCLAALDFHQIGAKEKDININISKCSKEEDMRKEAEKCILLCSNCHREEHERLRNLS